MLQHIEDLNGHYIEGWEQIRSALEHVEVIRRNGREAKVEIVNSNADTKLKMTLRSTKELDEYFKSHLRKLILNGLEEDTSIVTGRIHIS